MFQKSDSDEMFARASQKLSSGVSGVWKPRCMREGANKLSLVPNINDQEMFPTFEDAEKIEKLRKDDERKRWYNSVLTVILS